MKAVQHFSDAYLYQCRNLSSEQIVQFLEDFRLIHSPQRNPGTKLISIKVETDLLNTFKTRAKLDGVPYQTRIKALMQDSLSRPESD